VRKRILPNKEGKSEKEIMRAVSALDLFSFRAYPKTYVAQLNKAHFPGFSHLAQSVLG
jgi:hypothetical protein